MNDDSEFLRLMPVVVDKPREFLRQIEAKIAAGQSLTEVEDQLQTVAEVAINAERHFDRAFDAMEAVETILGTLGPKIEAGLPLSEEEDRVFDAAGRALNTLRNLANRVCEEKIK